MFIFLKSNIRFFIATIIAIVLLFIGLKYDWFSSVTESQFFYGMRISFLSAIAVALFIFIALRPKVLIAPSIIKRKIDGKDVFSFKFINTSLFRAFDVKLEAYVCYEYLATNNNSGKNVKTKKIPLRRSEWIYLPRWQPTYKNTLYAQHCVIVSTDIREEYNEEKYVKDLEKELGNQQEGNSNYVIFRVTLKHSFSNLSSTYSKKFGKASCIVSGMYKFGNSFDIL